MPVETVIYYFLKEKDNNNSMILLKSIYYLILKPVVILPVGLSGENERIPRKQYATITNDWMIKSFKCYKYFSKTDHTIGYHGC